MLKEMDIYLMQQLVITINDEYIISFGGNTKPELRWISVWTDNISVYHIRKENGHYQKKMS